MQRGLFPSLQHFVWTWIEHRPSLLESKSHFFISRCYCSRSLHFEPIVDFHGCSTYPVNDHLQIPSPFYSLSIGQAKRSEPILKNNVMCNMKLYDCVKLIPISTVGWNVSARDKDTTEDQPWRKHVEQHGDLASEHLWKAIKHACQRSVEGRENNLNKHEPTSNFLASSLMDKIRHQLIYVYKVHKTIILFILDTVC